MSPLAISLIALASIMCGTLLGMLLRTLLPEHHMSHDSKEVMQMGTAMIATLAALVLGLMISSAKGSFDMLSDELRQVSAKIIMLDQAMADYGPEAKKARDILRLAVMHTIERLWPAGKTAIATEAVGQREVGIKKLVQNIQQLSPRNDEQRRLRSRALQIIDELAAARVIVFESVGQRSLPTPFIMLLVCWLTIIFFSFGLYTGRGHATVITILFVCALSVSSSLLVILDMDQPFGGLIRISSAPLQNALTRLGQ
jgi:hypothetical protein